MMAPLEIVAAAFLLINVWLVARKSIFNYLFAVIAVSIYAWIFWQAKLYAVFALQFLFLGLNVYGLMNWKKEIADTGILSVSFLSSRARSATCVLTATLIVLIQMFLSVFTDAASPWMDSATTALSLVAQYWQAQAKAEMWILWILVNLSSVVLYASQQLWATALVNSILLVISIYGWLEWKRSAMENVNA